MSESDSLSRIERLETLIVARPEQDDVCLRASPT
jgi:hypothetical protein